MTPYVELHAQSAFSFLEAASFPERLAAEAAGFGYPALALVDADGVYGAPRFYRAAGKLGLRPLVGAALTLADGSRLPVLVETAAGYRRLCRLLTRSKARAPKGQARATLEDFEGESAGLVCLTGGLDGPLAANLAAGRREAARRTIERLVGLFGRGQVYVELQRHRTRESERRTRRLLELAASLRLPCVATNGVRYATPAERLVLDVFTALRYRTTLDAAGRRLEPNVERWLKPPEEMAQLFADQPAAVAETAELAARLGFTLKDLGYRFPDFPVPDGGSQTAYLRALTEAGARERYRPVGERVRRQLARELDLIEKLDLAGYFLIVWDIVRFCREQGILVQGRGSAANSAVCYSLGITAVDPVGMDLLFERFLSEERREWPDIDLDLPSGARREAVIQYVYRRYGAAGAGMTANVITYQPRRAAREVGKALGFPPDLLDRLARFVPDWGYRDSQDEAPARHLARAGLDPTHPRVRRFAELWAAVLGLPRHLGQHSGGMVLCAGRLDETVPLEPATMPGRVVVQWDKDDCADMGIVKVDLLGLGMMAVLEDALVLCREGGHAVDLAHLPPDDPAVYAALQQADTIGVFQVESRAQMATLPRLRPERFYDLVVEVAIIRPGPIVGDMVHPYLARRAGRAPVSYPHPSLEPILRRTLGVPLFQEQLLRMAMVTAGFTGGEAEELRRALGFRRSEARMQAVERKLRAGMTRNGITGPATEEIVRAITSFAEYGFPESHAASFALLAYASAYLKVRYPAQFYAALLNNQPMGFYHPATIVQDAQRHGQEIRPVDVSRSDWPSAVEDGAVRLGLMTVKGLREAVARRLVGARRARPFDSVDDLVARAGLAREELTTLAGIGALEPLGLTRRGALWEAERAARPPGPLWAGRPIAPEARGPEPSPLREMTVEERLVADYRGTGLTVGPQPMALRRRELERLGVTAAAGLVRLADGQRVRVAGSVIVRQRPGTAKGFVFLSIEDETGIANAIVRPALFERDRAAIVHEPFLLVEGVLQHQDGVTAVRATCVRPLPPMPARVPSHDFH
ncbi:MAG: error-prone DNA polymerase [Candidatus Rokubacteria bacterium]|nr:error-prone DNA polymerase [Candidatus Rokubacteria bacterium]